MKGQEQFIHPYRESRRCFNRYFNNSNYLRVSQKKISVKQQPSDFLDNVSRASSIKIRENPFENEIIYREQIKQEPQNLYLTKTKTNRRNISLLQNPQIYHLISKHVEKDQTTNKKVKILSSRKSQSQHSSKYGGRSFSIDQFKKTPKITEFTRQTFHRQLSSKRSSFSSKKQKQDILHSNNNLDINSQKISLSKRTLPWKQRNTFIACEVYMIKKRVGIDASILTGTSKQIKFRLIMNQSDTKTFQLYWNKNPEEFLQKCITITEHGIKLKLGVFNVHNQQEIKVSPLKQAKKTYLRNYESFAKSKIKQKISPIRVGNIFFCQQYKSQRKNVNQKEIYHQRFDESEKIKIDSFKLGQSLVKKNSQQLKAQKEHIQNVPFNSIEQDNQNIKFNNNSSLKQIIEQNYSKLYDSKEEAKIQAN